MMNIQAFWEKPKIFKILMAVILLITAFIIFSFFRNMHYSTNKIRPFVTLFLWLSICAGFFLTKRWAWGAFSVLVTFSILSITHSLIARQFNLNFYPLISVAIGAFVMGCLNQAEIRRLFHVDWRNEQAVPAEITNFAVLCIALALFIFMALLGMNKLAAGSMPTRLFVGFLGVAYLLLGIGAWQLNKSAFQAAPSILIFALISVTIMLAFDFFETHRFLAVRKSVFYLSISAAVLIYWVKYVRLQLPGEDDKAP
jgi:hypothetical protein